MHAKIRLTLVEMFDLMCKNILEIHVKDVNILNELMSKNILETCDISYSKYNIILNVHN